jgi:hypothetical protein
VPGYPPVGSIRRSRERTHEQSDRRTGRQQSCQVRHGPTTGVGAAVGRHEMPGLHLPLGVHPHQKILGLRALERDGSEVAVPIPGEDLGQRPPAEPAVIVEQDHRAFHAHRVEEHRHLVRDPVCSSTRKRSEDQVLFLRPPGPDHVGQAKRWCPLGYQQAIEELGRPSNVRPQAPASWHLRKCRQRPLAGWRRWTLSPHPSLAPVPMGPRPALPIRVLTLECAPRRTLAT